MSAATGKITKQDLEGKLRALQTGVTGRVESTKPSLIKIGAGIGFVVLVLTFLLGQRRGKRKTAIVEIRRF
ncbi:MAG: hypothetical protein JWL70_1289 [Acidimicrobiia bacterium]|nr:hypothetical protein [Acidimicrobiia bacterium]